ncbi:DUF4942 domain-containing protein [Bradyrhizobium sp. WSM2254]|uniref:DUF4942 domain-containing protein n=1 Tax=Bradyrhizobium sp. WSM2254 TaxID=1188263 RepID=UPI0009FF2A89|nr:DUF4942 domain-containing protein [Bradyrhizobium sp. WSM2254]
MKAAFAPATTDIEETHAAGTGLMPRATVEALVGKRNLALSLFGEAHQALSCASQAIEKACRAGKELCADEDRYNHHQRDEKAQFLAVPELPNRDNYLGQARKIVDTDLWSAVIRLTDLERFMDRQAKDQLYQQLLTDPPEATVDNIYATLRQFIADADTIFKRGIANCFSKLDRRFRSHDGFKIGSRVILDRMFDEHGWWNYHRDMEATLLDIERTFFVIEGLAVPPSYGGIVGMLRHRRGWGHGPRQDIVENDFFKVCVYKNGNAHVWFKRDDLVEKVNKLLADYYGEVIPDGQTPEDDGGLFTPKTSLAKNYGFYPTPDGVADRVIDATALYRAKEDPPLTILEPSAGTGNLARPCAMIRAGNEHHRSESYTYRALVDCVEIQPALAEALRGERIYRHVYQCDFLALKPDPQRLYDRVVMNPPFDRERDIDHVVHALEFLKPDGFLIAIMSAGTEFRETRKAVAFRALMQKMRARFDDLPAGSFSAAGTNVNTLMLRVWKDGRHFY